MQTAEVQASRPPMGGIVSGIVLNAVIPVLLYKLSRRYLSPSQFTALVVATTFPLGKSLFDSGSQGQINPISMVALLAIAIEGVASFLDGSPRLLLVRESLFTGVFGLFCFVSLLLPRPMMFYFGLLRRHISNGAQRIAGTGEMFLGLDGRGAHSDAAGETFASPSRESWR